MTPSVQRARLQFHEHELGDWMRARRAPDVRLSFGTYDPYDYP